jgi:hypothetical protein
VLSRWFDGYNQERPHQALDYATPGEVYFDPGARGAQPAKWEATQRQQGRDNRNTGQEGQAGTKDLKSDRLRR